MRTREGQLKPWGYISPFAFKTLRDRARCDMTITKKETHNITMPLYTAEHIFKTECQTERRVRAELSAQIEQQEETIKALQVDLSDALAQIDYLTF